MTNQRAIHFGVVPIDPDPQADPVSVDGHTDPSDEFELAPTIYVSGSWKCWGPADQDTDGDQTLHVVANQVNHPTLIEALRSGLGQLLGPNSRLLDYAVVTDAEDYSDVIGVQAGGFFYRQARDA